MTDINATPGALKALHDALARFRCDERDVADRASGEIKRTLDSLETKADRWRLRLQQCQADLERCEYRAAAAAREGGYVDCSGYARAVAEAEERLDHVRGWQQRVGQETDAFRAVADRFRSLIEVDVPRTEAHLLAIIEGLQDARDVQIPGT